MLENQSKSVKHHRYNHDDAKYNAPDAHITLFVFAEHTSARIALMQDSRKTRNAKTAFLRLMWRSLGLVVLMVLAVFAVRGAWDMYGKFAAASQAQTQSQSQLSEIQSRYNEVQSRVQSLSSPRGQEVELRARYGVAWPGEGEIDIVRIAPTSTSSNTSSQSWWSKFWHAIFMW